MTYVERLTGKKSPPHKTWGMKRVPIYDFLHTAFAVIYASKDSAAKDAIERSLNLSDGAFLSFDYAYDDATKEVLLGIYDEPTLPDFQPYTTYRLLDDGTYEKTSPVAV